MVVAARGRDADGRGIYEKNSSSIGIDHSRVNFGFRAERTSDKGH
jgi:hypothetical protein